MTEPRHWFYILREDTESARYHHAARLTEKAWLQGDRIGLLCQEEAQRQAVDDCLWTFRPGAFLPHEPVTDAGPARDCRVGLLTEAPRPGDWDTLILLGGALPPDSHEFPRLALIASSDPQSLDQARRHYRTLKTLGVTPRVLDLRQ